MQSVTKVETRKKAFNFGLKKNYFLTVQYLDGPRNGVEKGALAALAVTGALISAHSASSQLVTLVSNRVCANLDTANQNCTAGDIA